MANALRWQGQEYDSETELYCMRGRYYDPFLGRFLSEDPIGLAGGINPYVFAGNDPVNGSDPSGLSDAAGDDWNCATFSEGRTVCLAVELPGVQITADAPGGGFVWPDDPAGLPDARPSLFGPGGKQGPGQQQPRQNAPSCRAIVYYGSHGKISVQTGPSGRVAWGITMYDQAANAGPWWVETFVGRKQVEGKYPPRQNYNPHGSVPAPLARSGAVFRIEAKHIDFQNNAYTFVPNACIIP